MNTFSRPTFWDSRTQILHGSAGILLQSAVFKIPAPATNEILLQGWISELVRPFNHTLIFTGYLAPYVWK
jgi:hypothetical protein